MPGKVKQAISETAKLVKGLNINVKLYFGSSILYSIVQVPLYISIFFLVYTLGGQNIDAGTIFGLGGLAGIIGLIISGILSDRWRRDFFIWLSLVLINSSSILLWFANSFTDLIIMQILQSLGFSFFQPAGSAMVADSTTKGTRTKIYTLMAIFQQIGAAIGGVAGFFLYRYLGDTFEYSTIISMIRICIVVIFIASIPFMFIHDKRSLLEKREDERGEQERLKNELIMEKYKNCKNFKEKLAFYRTPIIIVFADFVIAFGAGMIIPFLPKFFEQHYHRTLSELTLIFSTAPLATATISALLFRLGKKIGRAKAVFWIELVAVCLLFTFATYPPFALLMVIYILREATMNAGWPLINAIVMDVLPKNQRATFSAIDSLAFTAFNRASQPLGGQILDTKGFRPAFIITGAIYTLGVFSLLLIRQGDFETEHVE
ncbi:MAG: MFS transporter [Candidatus Heimdallarchaeaceae archaeon]